MSPRPLLDPSPSPSPPPLLNQPPRLPRPDPSFPTLSVGDQVACLRCPSDNDAWVKCLVQAQDFEPISTSWAKIHHLPQFHVLGKSENVYMVAVAVFVLPDLNDLEIPYKHANPSDWRPGADFSQRRWLVQNAIDGLSTRARGLVDLYRGIFKDRPTVSSNLSVPIEWAILLRDIKKAPADVLDTFCSSFLLLDSFLHDVTHPQTPMDRVIERLCQANLEMAVEPPPFAETAKHMHQISLLRQLLELAGGQRDVRQRMIDDRQSANDNLRYLCELLCESGSQTSGPLPSKGPRAIDGHCLDPTIRYTPFHFNSDIYKILPADLIDNLPYNTVDAALPMEHHRVLDCEPDEALSLFLCRYTSIERDVLSLRVWMLSVEGTSQRGRFVQLLCDAQTRRQTWIYLGALVCFESVLNNSGVAAFRGSFFCRFGHNESETLWYHVANCLYQIDRRCELDTVSWLVDEEWRPSQSMDRALVLYWHLRGLVPHDKACETLSSVYDETEEADRQGRVDSWYGHVFGSEGAMPE